MSATTAQRQLLDLLTDELRRRGVHAPEYWAVLVVMHSPTEAAFRFHAMLADSLEIATRQMHDKQRMETIWANLPRADPVHDLMK